METWILIAADARECAGLTPRLTRPQPLELSADFAMTGYCRGRRLVLAANGPGPRRAEAAAQAAAAHAPGAALVSIGFCGALDPALECGDIFIAGRVRDLATGDEFPTAEAGGSLLLSGDRVIITAAEKAALREATGAAAVEMEAAAVARTAAGLGRSFRCIRVVSDTAAMDLPLDFNRYRDPSGRFRTPWIALAAAARPWRVPALVRLGRDCAAAAEKLGEYLANL